MGVYGERVVYKIIVLCIAMIAGFIARKAKFIDEKSTKSLSAMLAYITNPCLIVSSLQTDYDALLLRTLGVIALVSMAVHGFLAVLTHFLFRFVKDRRDRAVYSFGMMYMNCGFMGYPIMEAMFPAHGLIYGVIYTVPFNLYCWSHGVAVMDGSGKAVKWTKMFLNPCFLATLFGTLLFVSRVRFPGVIVEGLDMVGGMTFPLSMIIIGALLAEVDLLAVFKDVRILGFSLLKIVIYPMLTLGVWVLLRPVLGPEVSLLAFVMAAMPTATNTAVLASLYGNNAHLAAKLVGVTTLFSLVALPVMISFAERVLA